MLCSEQLPPPLLFAALRRRHRQAAFCVARAQHCTTPPMIGLRSHQGCRRPDPRPPMSPHPPPWACGASGLRLRQPRHCQLAVPGQPRPGAVPQPAVREAVRDHAAGKARRAKAHTAQPTAAPQPPSARVQQRTQARCCSVPRHAAPTHPHTLLAAGTMGHALGLGVTPPDTGTRYAGKAFPGAALYRPVPPADPLARQPRAADGAGGAAGAPGRLAARGGHRGPLPHPRHTGQLVIRPWPWPAACPAGPAGFAGLACGSMQRAG